MGRWRGTKELEAERGPYLKRQQQDDRLTMKVAQLLAKCDQLMRTADRLLMAPENDRQEIMSE